MAAHGLYSYDYHQGIEPVSRGPAWDAYALEKARCSSFVQGLIDRGGRLAVPKALRRRKTKKDAAVYAADYKNRMGPAWEDGIRQHRQELQDWLDYLRRGKDRFPDRAPASGQLAPAAALSAQVSGDDREVCAANRVPLIDYSKLLTDDDFDDHIHVNRQGLPKTDAALMEIARKFLQEKNVWPVK